MLMFIVVLWKFPQSICGIMLDYEKKTWIVDAKWNYDSLKKGGPKKSNPPNLQFLPCFLDSLNPLIRNRNWLVVIVVGKQEYWGNVWDNEVHIEVMNTKYLKCLW
jgi:hypothetical protein